MSMQDSSLLSAFRLVDCLIDFLDQVLLYNKSRKLETTLYENQISV